MKSYITRIQEEKESERSNAQGPAQLVEVSISLGRVVVNCDTECRLITDRTVCAAVMAMPLLLYN